MAVAQHSFWALALALPGFLLLRAIGSEPGAFVDGLLRDLLSFAISWLGFALITFEMARLLQRQPVWPRFMAAWNYCNVVQYMLLMAASMPALLGLPLWMSQTCWLVALGWSIWLEYFAARTALRLSSAQAIGVVAADFLLGVAVDAALASFS